VKNKQTLIASIYPNSLINLGLTFRKEYERIFLIIIMYGVNGKILWVDLTKKEMWGEEISEEIYRKYLTGNGLGSYILNREMKGDEDPLGPDNILGIITGIFNSNGVPLGRQIWKSLGSHPLTGNMGEMQTGGGEILVQKFKRISGFWWYFH